MKKILCAVLILIIVFSAVLPAFAADTDSFGETVLKQTEKISVEEGKPFKYTFTAPKDAVYGIFAEPVSLGGAWVTISLDGRKKCEFFACSFEQNDSSGYLVGSCSYIGYEEIFIKSGTEVEIEIELKPEKFYFITYGSESGYQSDRIGKPFDFNFKVSYAGVSKMNIGENKSLNENECYIFTPDKTGIYTFSSSAAEGYASSAELYEENNVIILTARLAESAEKRDGSGDFDMTAHLTAGKSYLIDFYMEDADENHVEKGKIDCTVSRNTKKTVIAFETVKYYVNNSVKKFKSFFYGISENIKEKLAPFFEKVSDFLR